MKLKPLIQTWQPSHLYLLQKYFSAGQWKSLAQRFLAEFPPVGKRQKNYLNKLVPPGWGSNGAGEVTEFLSFVFGILLSGGKHSKFTFDFFAAHPCTPDHLIRDLLDDGQVNAEIAKRKNLKATWIDELIGQCQLEINWNLLEHQDLSTDQCEAIYKALKKEWEFWHYARWAKTSEAIFRSLNKSPDLDVRRSLAKNRHLKPWMLLKFTTDGDEKVKTNAASNSTLTASAQSAVIRTDPEPVVLQALAANPNSTSKVLQEIYASLTLRGIDSDRAGHTIQLIVSNQNCSGKLLLKIFESIRNHEESGQRILKGLAGNKNCTAKLLGQVFQAVRKKQNFGSNSVVEEILANPSCPEELLLDCYGWHLEWASNEVFKRGYLIDFALNSREALIRKPNCPVPILEDVANHYYPNIRALVAKNENAPPDLLDGFLRDRSKFVQENLAENRNSSSDLLAKIWNRKINQTRKMALLVYSNPNCGEDTRSSINEQFGFSDVNSTFQIYATELFSAERKAPQIVVDDKNKKETLSKFLLDRDRNSEKFWEVLVKDNIVTRRWGKLGIEGQSTSREFKNNAAAISAAKRFIKVKTGAGYRTADKVRAIQNADRSLNSKFRWEKYSYVPFFSGDTQSALSTKMKGFVVPDHVKKIIESLNNIDKNDGILVLNDVVDLATMFMIASHKNENKINEIRLKQWKPVPLKQIRKDYSKQLAKFNSLFRVDIPDFVFELNHYHQCMDELVLGEKSGILELDLHGFETLREGIFRSVFKGGLPDEEDVLSLRYLHHPLNYFPLFSYGCDRVTQGLIYDFHENCFSPFIGYLDDEIFAGEGIWNCLSESFYEGEDEYEDEYSEFHIDPGEFSYEDLNDLLGRQDSKFNMLRWFYNLATIGYLNFHEMPSIKHDPKSEARYLSYYLGDTKSDNPSKGKTFFVLDIERVYPRLTVRIEDNFHPIFSYELLESFLSVFCNYGSAGFGIRKFMQSGTDILELMGLEAEDWQSKKEISVKDENVFINAVEQFCNSEIKAGRPHLAFLVGLYAWHDMEKQTTKLSARLLQNLPDDICPPIIKTVAKLHSETRFDRSILI